MPKAAGNLQDSVLNQLRKDNAEVEFFFLSGKSIRGTVRGFDNFTIIVRDTEGHHHLVYKHAVAHVASERPFGLRQQQPAAGQKRVAPQPKTEESESGEGASKAPEDSEKKKGGKEPFNRIDLSQIKLSE
ncbi:MAG: RNA chaperone Hfq [Candidatus Sumerlaeaceae bacterium]|jgi:host factor-I protein